MEVASGFVAAGFLIPTVHLALEVTETGQENPHGDNPSSVDWVAVSHDITNHPSGDVKHEEFCGT